jgi:predicted DNA-binding protein
MQIKEREPITISLSKKTIERLNQLKKITGTPISHILEKAFEKVYDEKNETS